LQENLTLWQFKVIQDLGVNGKLMCDFILVINSNFSRKKSKVKCGIPKYGNVCRMVCKMRNAENLTAVALYAYNGLKNAVSIELRNGI